MRMIEVLNHLFQVFKRLTDVTAAGNRYNETHNYNNDQQTDNIAQEQPAGWAQFAFQNAVDKQPAR